MIIDCSGGIECDAAGCYGLEYVFNIEFQIECF